MNGPVILPRASGTGNQAVAPVCPISGSEQPPGMPGVMLPVLTRATDLPSLIRAINQLNQLLQFVFKPPVPSSPILPGHGTPQIAANNSGSGTQGSDWYEVPESRKTMTVIYIQQDDDPESTTPPEVIQVAGNVSNIDQYAQGKSAIAMKLIKSIKFKSKVGNGRWEFVRGPLTIPVGYLEGAYDEGGGDIHPPYREDWLQNVINVQWSGGLAVQFFDGAN